MSERDLERRLLPFRRDFCAAVSAIIADRGEVRASYVVRHLHPHEPELLALVGEYEEHLQVLVYQWLEDFIEQIVPDRQELPVYRRRPGVSLTGLQVALKREGERVFDFADEDPF